MNVLEGAVQSTSPLAINCNGRIISPLTGRAPEKDDVLLGIRPEDVMISDQKSEGSFEVTVSVIEPAGSFSWIDVVWNGVLMKGTAQGDVKITQGGKAYAAFSSGKVIVFDAESGKRL